MDSHNKEFTLFFKPRDKAILAKGKNSNYINNYPQDLYFYDNNSNKEISLVSYDWFPKTAKKFKLPIICLGLGEKEDDLQIFDARIFADAFTQIN